MCEVDGCDKPVHAKGLCQAHYRQMRRRERGLKKPGSKPDPTRPKSRYNPEGERGLHDLADEVRDQYVPKRKSRTETHCANGHELREGTYYWQENSNYADGWRLVCRLCSREWQARYHGRSPLPDDVPVIQNRDKTHCKKGHEYTEENTRFNPDGSRQCVTCQKEVAFHQRLKRYGLTQEEFENLTAVSGEACQICGEETAHTLHIDHEHESGKVRGLLCNNCNAGLGRFGDDPDLLEAAAQYLRSKNG